MWNKPNKQLKEFRLGFLDKCLHTQDLNLRTHAHNMHAWDLFKNPSPEAQNKK